MRVVVDLSSGAVSLEDSSDMEGFSVLVLPAAPGDPTDAAALGAVAAALSVHDAGIVDPEGNAFIPVDVVRHLAEDAVRAGAAPPDPEWESRFAAMVERASAEGWLTEDDSIQAHIEWGRT